MKKTMLEYMLPINTLILELSQTYQLNMFSKIIQEILSTIACVLGLDDIHYVDEKVLGFLNTLTSTRNKNIYIFFILLHIFDM